jgi:glycosyltransferase involved in cell wall biosynthesis
MKASRSQKHRIFITGPHLEDPGGVANYYNAVMPELQKFDHLDIRYHSVGSSAAAGNIYLHWVNDQFRTFRAMKRIRPDLVLVNPSLNFKSFIRDALITFSAVMLSAKVVVFYRGWDVNFERKVDRYFLGFFRQTFAKANSAIVLASDHGKRLQSWGLTCPIFKESTTVANHISLDAQKAVVQRFETESRPLRVLFLSRLEKAKGIYETIDAVSSIAKKGIPIELTIAGEGSESAEVGRYLKRLDSDDFINYAGYLKGEQKRQALFSHDVFCLPTKHGEGMPNSVLEAMMSGLVVLTSKYGGIKDFFQDGKMGYLVDPDNNGEIVHHLEALAENRVLCREIGLYNHDFAMKNFASPVVVQRLCSIFDGLLKGV